jgi:uncharacterized phage protein (TIGR01671 family)
MREIKFRGKARHHDNVVNNRIVTAGEWLYGDLSTHEEGLVWVDNWLAAPKTVGQYTGLKDKNGVKVFEGDIVELNYGKFGKARGAIEWSEKECAFMLIGKPHSPYALARVNESPEAAEILGNIHDTPELLGWNKEGAADVGL